MCDILYKTCIILKGIVYPKSKLPPKVIKDVDEFVSSSKQIWTFGLGRDKGDVLVIYIIAFIYCYGCKKNKKIAGC